MTRLIWISAISLSCLLQTGCSTLQSVPGRMKAMVFRTTDENDPLANISNSVADSYESAQKELKTADKTMLTFARWREDMGDYSEAKEKYRNILADNPHNVDARLGIARVEFATGRVTEAIDILNATGRKYPKRADVWSELGRIQVEREQWGPAVESLTKAVDMKPDDQSARYQLGVALAKSDRLQEAQPHLTAAVGESAAMYNIGFVLNQQNRTQESAAWFRKALNSHPDQRTKALSSQMLAKLEQGGQNAASNSMIAASKQKSTVDVELTSYEAYREVPGTPNGGAPNGDPQNSGTVAQQAGSTPSVQPAIPNSVATLGNSSGQFYGPPPAGQQFQPANPTYAGRPPFQQQAVPLSTPQQPAMQAAGLAPQTASPQYNQAVTFASQQTAQPAMQPQQFGGQPQHYTQAQYGIQPQQHAAASAQPMQFANQSRVTNSPTGQSPPTQLPHWNGTPNNAPTATYPTAAPPVTTQPPQWRGPTQ